MKIRTRFNLIYELGLLFILLILAGCGSGDRSATKTMTANPTVTKTLPAPSVITTQVPDPQKTVTLFLDAWKSGDYPAMYGLLSSSSKAAITEEEFTKRYQSAMDEGAFSDLNYSIKSVNTHTNEASADYSYDLTSSLVGNVGRDNQMSLVMVEGGWRINWEDKLILPELAGGNVLSMDRPLQTRQSILDRNGNPLASQEEATAIGFYPDNIDPEQADSLISLMSRVSGINSEIINSWIQAAYPGDYLPLTEIKSGSFSGLVDALTGNVATIVSNYTSRFYPNRGVAPHLVGYVSAIQEDELSKYKQKGYRSDEKIGRKGIEAWGEDILMGKRGGTLYVLDPEGALVSQIGTPSISEPGQAIYTTIDKDLQTGVQQSLSGFKGAAVVLERDTGRILAMASSPDFNPNAFQTENYNWYTELGQMTNNPDSPQFNRAAQGQYPLGSIFKIITMAAALESGVYTKDSTYECGYDFNEVQGLVLHDWTWEHFQNDGRTQPSGMLTLPQGLIRSCNPFFWHVGLDLYRQGLTTAVSNMARAFGLGSKTGINIIEEEPGNIPDPQNEVDVVNLATGQGDTQVTPLQVADFMAAIGNGGVLYRPQAIEKIGPENGEATQVFAPEVVRRLPIKPENLKIIQDAMEGVTRSKKPLGTAYPVFAGLNIPVHGKTGTAVTGGNPHAWFAGYTDEKRQDKPDIAVAVLLENAGEGSEFAAPIFRRIVELYFLGKPQKLFPWESTYFVEKTPEPVIIIETSTPEP